jgi:hypothetical protein
MQPKLGVVDTKGEHHSTSCLHHPAAVPQKMPSREREREREIERERERERHKASPLSDLIDKI